MCRFFIFQQGNYYLNLNPWYQLSGTGSDQVDNPDIEKYLGHAEVRMAYTGKQHTVSLMRSNNLQDPNYGAFEVNWSFPMSRRVKGFYSMLTAMVKA